MENEFVTYEQAVKLKKLKLWKIIKHLLFVFRLNLENVI